MDTSEDIYSHGLIPLLRGNGVYEDILKNSPDSMLRELGEKALVTENDSKLLALLGQVMKERKYAWMTDGMIGGLRPSSFYISKENIGGTSPWQVWIVNKKWPLKENLAKHILRVQQVSKKRYWKMKLDLQAVMAFWNKRVNDYHIDGRFELQPKDPLQKIELQLLIIPFGILSAGFLISISTFCFEVYR